MSKETDDIITLDNIEEHIDSKPISDNIYDYIVEFIEQADKIKAYTGLAKKYYVNSKLKEILPIETYQRYEPMIDKSIDYLVYLSKNPEVLQNINKTIKCVEKNCKSIFSCCK